MCELLGFHFNKPVRPNVSFGNFRQHAHHHKNGWGMAWYPDATQRDFTAQLIKTSASAMRDALAAFLAQEQVVQSANIIAHIRYMTHGDATHANTHPFARNYRKRELVFAHNGVLENEHLSFTGKAYAPMGKTDSERVFCHLLNSMKAEGLRTDKPEHYAALEALLTALNRDGKMNLLFSDGTRLFAWHTKTQGPSLYYTRRIAPFGQIYYKDDGITVNLDEQKDPDLKGYIIATQPLTEAEQWLPLEKGRLHVFEGGDCIFGM